VLDRFRKVEVELISGTPRALNAPGSSSVCPTSMMVRKLARLQLASTGVGDGVADAAPPRRANCLAISVKTAARNSPRSGMPSVMIDSLRAFA